MLHNLYSLRDLKTKRSKQIFQCSSDDEAKRLVHSSAFTPQGPTLFAQYPDDFLLLRHGTFGDEDGSITGQVDYFDKDHANTPYLKPVIVGSLRDILVAYGSELPPKQSTTTKKKGK